MNLFRKASFLATAFRHWFSNPTRGLPVGFQSHRFLVWSASLPQKRRRPRLRNLFALPLLLTPGAGLLLAPRLAQAQVVRNFDTYPGSTDPFRFQTTARGDIIILGNTLMSCQAVPPAPVGACNTATSSPPPNAPAGTNASFIMQYVNVDPAPGATFANSSTATLNLPAGSTVVFAGLYWGAHGPFPGPPVPDTRQRVQFKTPTTAYTTVNADSIDAFTIGVPGGAPDRVPYQSFADVTALVQAGGNGIYSVADVAAQSPTAPAPFTVANNLAAARNRYAGWTLAIVYEDPNLILRSLTVYDGFAFARCPGGVCSPANSVVTFTLSGFTTPSTSPILTSVGSVVYDGDRGTTGEVFQINTTQLSGPPLNPLNDFFNSSIVGLDAGGAPALAGTAATPTFPAKNPNFGDQLGFDIDVVDVSALSPIPPGATSATLTFETVLQQEGYSPGIFTLAIEAVPEPNFRLVKRITNVTRGGVTISGVDFSSIVDDLADDDDNAAGFSQIPLVGVTSIDDSVPLQSGDVIEYTVYFLSDGVGPTDNTQFCDPIPSGTTFVESGFGASTGISVNRAGTVATRTNASDGDTGTFSSPLAPLPAGNGCPSQTNANGAVTVNLGTVSATTGNNFGFVRFQVSVN